jgi:hypothetical protein
LTMKVKEIKVILGGDLSTSNSKMPGASFGLSTSGCKVGGKLRNVCGSVCEKCYAHKLEKLRPSVKLGWQNRTDALEDALGDITKEHNWIVAMVQRIGQVTDRIGSDYFRWHDSGDLLALDHLRMIVAVVEATPHINHWLPTKEKRMVAGYLRLHGDFPANLSVRVSAAMIGAEPLEGNGNTCTVHRKGEDFHGQACPASQQGGACGDCRACWDTSVVNVSYPLH